MTHDMGRNVERVPVIVGRRGKPSWDNRLRDRDFEPGFWQLWDRDGGNSYLLKFIGHKLEDAKGRQGNNQRLVADYEFYRKFDFTSSHVG